jgi:hypothetical protein
MIMLLVLHGYTGSVKIAAEKLGPMDTVCELQCFICIVIKCVQEDV